MDELQQRQIEIAINIGLDHPFDVDDNGVPQIQSIEDWATKAARAVIADLMDRRNIKHGFDDIDEDIRKEIVETMSAIIRKVKAVTA